MSDETSRQVGVHTDARVELEDGRYAVYLDILMVDDAQGPAGLRSTRISDYPDEKTARVAAEWMERAARRVSDDPTGH